MYKRPPPQRLSDFSGGTLQSRSEWHKIVKILKKKNFQTTIVLFLAKLSFRIEGRKSFSNKQKLEEFITSNLGLQEILKGFISAKNKRY